MARGGPGLASKTTINLLWFSMVVSIFVYGVVAWFVTQSGKSGSGSPQTTFFYALTAVSVFTFFNGVFMMRKMLDPQALLKKPTKAAAWAELQSKSVVVMAIFESVAVFGLVWVFMTFRTDTLPYFLGGSLVGQLLLRHHLNGVFEALDRGRWTE